MGGVTWLGPVELDLETLRSLVTVSAEGSLARAAPLLFVTTSGLSRRIHELERKLGVELLERSMRGVVLTPAGEQILVHARKILETCDELFATARELAAGPGWHRVVHLGIVRGSRTRRATGSSRRSRRRTPKPSSPSIPTRTCT